MPRSCPGRRVVRGKRSSVEIAPRSARRSRSPESVARRIARLPRDSVLRNTLAVGQARCRWEPPRRSIFPTLAVDTHPSTRQQWQGVTPSCDRAPRRWRAAARSGEAGSELTIGGVDLLRHAGGDAREAVSGGGESGSKRAMCGRFQRRGRSVGRFCRLVRRGRATHMRLGYASIAVGMWEGHRVGSPEDGRAVALEPPKRAQVEGRG